MLAISGAFCKAHAPFPQLEHVSFQEGILKKGLIREQLVPVPHLPIQTQMELTVPKHRIAAWWETAGTAVTCSCGWLLAG